MAILTSGTPEGFPHVADIVPDLRPVFKTLSVYTEAFRNWMLQRHINPTIFRERIQAYVAKEQPEENLEHAYEMTVGYLCNNQMTFEDLQEASKILQFVVVGTEKGFIVS